MLNDGVRWARPPWQSLRSMGRLPVEQAVPRVLANCVRTVRQHVRLEVLKEGSYLVPVRVFIGVGWLRAFAEKAVEPGWRDGTRLSAFLARQLDAGMVVFSPYQMLVSDAFLTHAMLLGWVVMLGQLLAGVAILSGTLTSAALLGGIFMNLNFLLAGVPDPSTFYIVIQTVLLLAGAGAILGIDAWLDAPNRSFLPGVRAVRRRSNQPIGHAKTLALVAPALGCAVYSALQIKDWTPGGSVHDPAAILTVLAIMAASWATIIALRGGDHTRPPA